MLDMGLTLFAFWSVLGWITLASCNLETEYETNCNRSIPQQIEYQFTTNVVRSEHIVTFTAYFSKVSRENYITAALKNAGIMNWTILQRQNPAKDYRSDFEVVILNEEQNVALKVLGDHPAVRRVTAQHQVQRTLKYIKEDCGSPDCLYSGWRSHNIKGRALHTLRKHHDKDGYSSRKLLRTVPRQITSVLKADVLWSLGVTGEGIKVAVFDTGLSRNHPHFSRIRERTDWTGEKTLDDALGHGTFVAGVIASRADCLGFAPDAELHIFRVFTDNQAWRSPKTCFQYKGQNIINTKLGGINQHVKWGWY